MAASVAARLGPYQYAVALGSNMRSRHGSPAGVLAAVIAVLRPVAVAPVVSSAPVGPSLRRYANGAAIVRSALAPPEMLAWLKAIEREFGRRGGRRWGARVLDLDIVLWSGGRWRSRVLTIPHPRYRSRDFVLAPLAAVAPGWRDPVTGRTVRQARARLTRPRPLPTAPGGW